MGDETNTLYCTNKDCGEEIMYHEPDGWVHKRNFSSFCDTPMDTDDGSYTRHKLQKVMPPGVQKKSGPKPGKRKKHR